MKTKRVLNFVTTCATLIIVLTIIIGTTGCGKREDQEKSHLQRALAMTPSNASQVFFTDWDLIKGYEGYDDLDSQDSMDRRQSFIVGAFMGNPRAEPPELPRQALASSYAQGYFLRHAETWRWDSTDLVWEATIGSGEGPPTYILQFPDDFDFEPLRNLFQERDFDQSEQEGVTIYSHEMDLEAEWLRSLPTFAILNTAVLPEEKKLVLSSQPAGVQAVLDAHQGENLSLADQEAAQALVEQMGEVAAAFIGGGLQVCQELAPGLMLDMMGERLSAEQVDKLREQFESGPELHPFTALGVGYRYEEEELVSLIVFHYANAETAEADLEARRQLIREGISLMTQRPLAETLLTLEKAEVPQGSSDLVLQVDPVGGMPRRLFQMIFVRDMLFAACP